MGRGTNMRETGRLLLSAAACAAILAAGCTPQQALVGSLLPGGTVPVLLSHLERLDDRNRRHIVELEKKGDWRGLAKFAETNLAKDAWNADWWMVAGYAYTQLNEHHRAAECFAETVRLAPDQALGWNLLAQSYRTGGQPERAVHTLQNALLVRSDSATTFYLLGESYRDLRRDVEAVSSYQEAVRLQGTLAHAWLGMGRAYARLGRADEVGKVREVLEKLDPVLARELGAPPPAR
jgi:cytochrome c-type biogenesis protein CcmH/NrfG